MTSTIQAETPDFAALGLSPELLSAITYAGYSSPTPIQQLAIPLALMGRDVMGCAQTGTGKTASFVLPMIEILAGGRAKARMPRSLILTPTRELAAQIAENFEKYGKNHKLNMALIVGGESMTDQKSLLTKGVDVLIATPGRLMDQFERGNIMLNDIKLLVLDECDRMLDMGFIPDVEKIVKTLPKMRQTMMFSATFAPEIKRLADSFLMNPKMVEVAHQAMTAKTVSQFLVPVPPDAKRKRAALRQLLTQEEVKNAFIFCNRKTDVAIVAKSLTVHGFSVGALHGDMAQSARNETLQQFKAGEISLMVCSDVAARGLDVSAVSHVFNFDVPIHAEDYVHRIGRTGRAGMEGRAFTLFNRYDSKHLAAIEKLIGVAIEKLELSGFDVNEAASEPAPTEGRFGRHKNQLRKGGKGRDHETRGHESRGHESRGGESRHSKPSTPIENILNASHDEHGLRDNYSASVAILPAHEIPAAALPTTAPGNRSSGDGGGHRRPRPPRPERGHRPEGRHDTRPEARQDIRHEPPHRPEMPRFEQPRPDTRHEPRYESRNQDDSRGGRGGYGQKSDMRHDARFDGRNDNRHQGRRRYHEDDHDVAVLGFGDMVPAFLRRPLVLRD